MSDHLTNIIEGLRRIKFNDLTFISNDLSLISSTQLKMPSDDSQIDGWNCTHYPDLKANPDIGGIGVWLI